jgi:hypothetical protein
MLRWVLVGWMCAATAAAQPLYNAERDYLTPELRAAVEALKAEVAAGTPTTLNNLDARLDVIWPWANALSAQGVHLPVELPRIVSQGRQVNFRRQYAMVVLPPINGLVRELQIKEEQPGAIGTVTANTTGPWAVRTPVTFEQTYTVGDMPMQPGGGIMVAWELVARLDPYQRDDPAAKNFISIRCSNPEVRWEESTQQILGMHGNIFGAIGLPSYTLKGPALVKGDTITVVYGDRSGGSPGLELQTTQVDGAMFPLYVDLEGKGNFLSPRWPAFTIEGGAPARVAALAPSVVKPGEAFELSIRTEDRYYNRASGRMPAYEVRVNGKSVATAPAGRNGLSVVPGLTIEEEGVVRFEVMTADETLRGLSNPVWVTRAAAPRIFWGDTHAHTNMAEGQGSIANFYRYAREDARLDFVALSEHDIWMDDGEWVAMQAAVREHNDPPNFVTYLAYEWSAIVEAGGHHNIYFRTPDDRKRVPIQDTGGLVDLFQGLDRMYDPKDVMIIPHAHIPGDWRMAHPRIEPLVEMTSMHGTFEWFGNYYLRNGHMIGFVGASDDHAGRPGYSGGFRQGPLQHFNGLAAVLAPEKTGDAIFDAMQARHVYATTGQRTILDLRMNGKTMGERLAYAEQRKIEGRVTGTAPIDRVDVVKNGEIVSTTHFLQRVLSADGWLELSVGSQSEDLIRDTPRGHRIWLGTATIEGATVEAIDAGGLINFEAEWARTGEADANTIQFRMVTRGAEDRLLIKLSGVSENTKLRFHADPTAEEGVTFPRFYEPSRAYPPVDLVFTFADLKGGETSQGVPTGRYTDTVALRWIERDAPLDQPIAFSDPGPVADGDYYYVRVTQLDGRMAWSSPWWVGGVPVR